MCVWLIGCVSKSSLKALNTDEEAREFLRGLDSFVRRKKRRRMKKNRNRLNPPLARQSYHHRDIDVPHTEQASGLDRSLHINYSYV